MSDTPAAPPRTNDDPRRDTPMMQQYREAKARHPGMILLFRMGDFYETFDGDAELLARELGLALTSRDKTVPMAGFPHHSLDNHLRKLLQAGHRVAVCDQIEDAALAKGLVKREVTRVVTPGTITEDELLDPRQPNHIAALYPAAGGFGLAWAEPSTGEFWAGAVAAERLIDELERIGAAECLLAESAANRLSEATLAALPRTVTSRPDWTFDPQTTAQALRDHFGVATLGGFGFHDDEPCLAAAGALLLYLRETLRAGLDHVRRLRPFRPGEVLALDEVTRRSLELTRTLRDGSRDGSLLGVLDRTVSPMGARLLHDALLTPLADKAAIEARLDAVGELVGETSLRGDLRELLKSVPDLQRLASRVSTGRASPRDLANVARTLRLLPKFKARVTGRRAALLAELEGRLELCPELRTDLDAALADDPPADPKEGGVIRPGHSAELDELRQLAGEGKNWIARYQAQESTRLAVPSLKTGYNQIDGYYLEVTHTHLAKVPADYFLVKQLKNANRYTTADLKRYEERVLTAQERALVLEAELFAALRSRVAAQTGRLLATAEVLARVDFLAGLAELAASRQYVRPMLLDAPGLDVRDGRHPVLEQTLPPGTFVPNDVCLGPETGMFWLVTGPNMAGKSTFLRQAALLMLMAQVGSFVPARSMKFGVADRIFTRVGASDELSRGLSTFMVEMTEAANILNNATARSLVILDEIGRGTSTYDGVSLAWAITEFLHDTVGARSLFATHYHELAQLAESLKNLRNYTVQVREADDRVIFLHKIAPGSAERSYGIHVARMAGVPDAVIARAEGVLAELEARHQLPEAQRRRVVEPPEKPRKKKRTEAGPGLFGGEGEG
jgi:DNA mismatch repair protein MutS